MTKKRIIIAAIILAVAGSLIYYFATRNAGGKYQFTTVTQGSITESVTVTGNTTPETSLDLAFQNGGTVIAVNKKVGDHVNAGDVIARLDTSDLQAQLAQAQANVDAEQAQLANLQAGAQPADVQASQAALAGGQQTLANDYGNAGNVLSASYASANDAVRTQLQSFFSNSENNNPQLTFSITDSQLLNNLQTARVQASAELNAWQKELQTISASSPSAALDADLASASKHLSAIKSFLTLASNALVQQTNLSSATLATYNTELTAATTETNTANTNVTNATQTIASQKITIQQLQAQLNLKLAGSTSQQIAAQQAQVEQAQATMQSVQVKINEASLVSPISGVITAQSAKVGQIATPGAVATSVISDNNLEVDAFVPETDIGKVSIGNPVKMTLDAFPGETFAGKVFYIDPAATNLSGVVDYKIKTSFNTTDPRMRSGLTANLTIETHTDTNALILPQYAVLQNDQGSFVEVIQNGAAVQVPVTLGVSDGQGNIQIASGVTAGEQVVNIGLKQ
jgi:HlyD family secretion protein